MEDIALFGHLLGVLAFVAGLAIVAVSFETARRRDDPREVATLLRLARSAIPLVGGGGVLLFGCGLWLMGLEDLGGAGWVSAALVLFVLAMALGGMGGAAPKQARVTAEHLAAEGAPAISPQLRALLDDRRSRTLNHASAVLILAVLVLMVFKP